MDVKNPADQLGMQVYRHEFISNIRSGIISSLEITTCHILDIVD